MKPVYRFGRAVTSLIFRLGGVKVIGRENIPEDKALIIVCNHVSYADPPAIAMIFPRQITFIAKEEFAKHFFTLKLFGALGAVFLKKGESDLGAMRVVMRELKEERPVALFPEGGRHRDQQLGEFKSGASYIAYRTGARVLPLAVLNTGDFFRIWKRNIRILIGEPIEMPQGMCADKEALSAYTQVYREKIAELVERGRELLLAEGKKMRAAAKLRP